MIVDCKLELAKAIIQIYLERDNSLYGNRKPVTWAEAIGNATDDPDLCDLLNIMAHTGRMSDFNHWATCYIRSYHQYIEPRKYQGKD